MSDKPSWSPDSWVKIILIGCLAVAFLFVTSAMAIRAIFSDLDLSSNNVVDVFNQFIGLFGVVVGYVLGSKRKGD